MRPTSPGDGWKRPAPDRRLLRRFGIPPCKFFTNFADSTDNAHAGKWHACRRENLSLGRYEAQCMTARNLILVPWVFMLSGAFLSGVPWLPFEASRLKDKHAWTQVNETPYSQSPVASWLCAAPAQAKHAARGPHEGSAITVYVNQIGREAMFSKSPRFPEG